MTPLYRGLGGAAGQRARGVYKHDDGRPCSAANSAAGPQRELKDLGLIVDSPAPGTGS